MFLVVLVFEVSAAVALILIVRVAVKTFLQVGVCDSFSEKSRRLLLAKLYSQLQ